ncbi:YkgJ family cysteine cluster protein [Vibrio parahaemolyticus]|nr:YkgJ family cysteine cluster protein [Vibrio parahaemolyticus]EIU6865350.1 YkgJ family cysteine cluster protein [Vibrio parahaemolyticus]EIU7065914.1 YkgJ family cysteine cluster protein [Vibrio parahaemolyticus]ELB2132602.1 YkgJ family cysteine cluster protein [Vibrio parahaemolyticus]ELB2147523.1 YkgJ family cysteine cluster protein [Vibrio parahaemolyticus]
MNIFSWFYSILSIKKPVKPIEYIDKNTERKLPEIPKNLLAESRTLQGKLDEYDEDPFMKLERVYGFLNSFGEFAKTFSVCSKGCSACCQNDVLITTLEANYIAKKTDYKVKRKFRLSKNNRTPCPFLKEGSCSIYQYRPFNCRTLYTLDDPKYCDTSEKHQLYGLRGGEGIPLIHQYKNYVNRLNANRRSADIRDFFS